MADNAAPRKRARSDKMEILEFMPLAPPRKRPRREGEEKKESQKASSKEKKKKSTTGDGSQKREAKYVRGEKANLKVIGDKKVRGALKKKEQTFRKAVASAASSEVLLTQQSGFLEAEGMEKTFKFTQEQIAEHVDVSAAKKVFNLTLERGPYNIDYTANGRFLLLGGKKGHLGLTDWQRGKLVAEVDLGSEEEVKDVKFLMNETMWAAAQRQYVFIYDQTGTELHCMRSHIEVNRLEYLPHHFLMATASNAGFLKYHDISTGKLLSEHSTKMGKLFCMKQNPYNAIVHLGHANGTVTLWSPNMSGSLVKMLCHRAKVNTIAFEGNNMITAGGDGQVKVWDLRTYKEVHAYFTHKPAATLDVSQSGLLAVGWGGHVQVWQDAIRTKAVSPYMNEMIAGVQIRDVQFVPHEDVLGVGHTGGFHSLLIPGSGNPNYDSFVANPFQTKKQRQEAEVHALLDKIPSELITLNPDHVGQVDRAPAEVVAEERRIEYLANNPEEKFQPKHKKRGRSSAAKRQMRKQKNVVDRQRLELEEKRARQAADRKEAEAAAARDGSASGGLAPPKSVLDRFKRR